MAVIIDLLGHIERNLDQTAKLSEAVVLFLKTVICTVGKAHKTTPQNQDFIGLLRVCQVFIHELE